MSILNAVSNLVGQRRADAEQTYREALQRAASARGRGDATKLAAGLAAAANAAGVSDDRLARDVRYSVTLAAIEAVAKFDTLSAASVSAQHKHARNGVRAVAEQIDRDKAAIHEAGWAQIAPLTMIGDCVHRCGLLLAAMDMRKQSATLALENPDMAGGKPLDDDGFADKIARAAKSLETAQRCEPGLSRIVHGWQATEYALQAILSGAIEADAETVCGMLASAQAITGEFDLSAYHPDAETTGAGDDD